MAILQEHAGKSNNPFLELIKVDLAPAGTWVATIIDIKDQFGVVRPTFDNPQVTEVVDLTTFLFGFRDQAGGQVAQLVERLGQRGLDIGLDDVFVGLHLFVSPWPAF